MHGVRRIGGSDSGGAALLWNSWCFTGGWRCKCVGVLSGDCSGVYCDGFGGNPYASLGFCARRMCGLQPAQPALCCMLM